MLDKIYLCIRQETAKDIVTIQKSLAEDGQVIDSRHFEIKLTSEETLCLEDGKKAELQLIGKLVNGDVVTTDIEDVKVLRTLWEKVI